MAAPGAEPIGEFDLLSDSESDREIFLREGLSLRVVYDPVTRKPKVQIIPTEVTTSRHKKSDPPVADASKPKRKRGKRKKRNLSKPTDPETPTQQGEFSVVGNKRLLRRGISVEVSEGAEVIDLPFEKLSEEKQVLTLQKKVLKRLKAANVPVTIVAQTTKLEDLLNERVEKRKEKENEMNSPAFFLFDLGTVVRKYVQWVSCFPRVVPYYAVKCNPDQNIIRTIQSTGGKFDCASVNEIKAVMEEGAKGNDIIFANPSKAIEAIRFARTMGVKKMTFDNEVELRKIHAAFPEAELVLRIIGDESKSLMAFGSKFGARVPDESSTLLEVGQSLKANIVGVSFHVGSWCTSKEPFIETLKIARGVFDEAKRFGYTMTLLDIGGGWPGFDTVDLSFRDIAKPIADAMDDLFPKEINIISEPGRYFASECGVLATRIIARRERVPVAEGEEPPQKPSMSYYLGDGVYGSFNNILFDHYLPQAKVLPKKCDSEALMSSSPHKSTLFGPTCDSIDVIAKDIDLPSLETGDYLYFCNMGAYTSAASSTFNGMDRPEAFFFVSVPDEDLWESVKL